MAHIVLCHFKSICPFFTPPPSGIVYGGESSMEACHVAEDFGIDDKRG